MLFNIFRLISNTYDQLRTYSLHLKQKSVKVYSFYTISQDAQDAQDALYALCALYPYTL